jgi:hypothetical protein
MPKARMQSAEQLVDSRALIFNDAHCACKRRASSRGEISEKLIG